MVVLRHVVSVVSQKSILAHGLQERLDMYTATLRLFGIGGLLLYTTAFLVVKLITEAVVGSKDGTAAWIQIRDRLQAFCSGTEQTAGKWLNRYSGAHSALHTLPKKYRDDDR
jgi:hypothetical protein